jgi:hypothetical protein
MAVNKRACPTQFVRGKIMPYYMCTVNGASIESSAQVVLNLSDVKSPSTTGEEFPDGAVFIAADAVKKEMLAIALAAISTQRQVWVEADQPNFDSDHNQVNLAQCYILAVVADYVSPPWLLS